MRTALQSLSDAPVQLPPLCAADTVRDGELPALGGVQIVFIMRVEGDKNLPFKGADPVNDGRDDGYGFGGAERAVDKILLQIHNDKIVLHDRLLSPSAEAKT
jgi:hypothetical protein